MKSVWQQTSWIKAVDGSLANRFKWCFLRSIYMKVMVFQNGLRFKHMYLFYNCSAGLFGLDDVCWYRGPDLYCWCRLYCSLDIVIVDRVWRSFDNITFQASNDRSMLMLLSLLNGLSKVTWNWNPMPRHLQYSSLEYELPVFFRLIQLIVQMKIQLYSHSFLCETMWFLQIARLR